MGRSERVVDGWIDGWISGVAGREEEKESEEDMWIIDPRWREG